MNWTAAFDRNVRDKFLRHGVGRVQAGSLPAWVRESVDHPENILMALLDVTELSYSFINLGSEAGVNDDPLHNYANLGADGIGVEMCPGWCQQHQAAHPRLETVCRKITPSNLLEALDGTNLLSAKKIEVPHATENFFEEKLVLENREASSSVDIVKVDIDSYDCALAKTLLEYLHPPPKLIIMEVQAGVPPPFRFFHALPRFAILAREFMAVCGVQFVLSSAHVSRFRFRFSVLQRAERHVRSHGFAGTNRGGGGFATRAARDS